MYLLDTNALSEPLKKRPSSTFTRRLEGMRGRRKFASTISLMELRYGCARNPHGPRLWERIQCEILPLVTLVSVDESVAERAGDLLAEFHERGRPRGAEDLLIGATALVHGLILVTHNTADFRGIPGLRLEDWMEAGDA